jgi:hypothetical protein
MKVYVNYSPIGILMDMTVKHAVKGADLLKEIEESKKFDDE